MKSSFKHPNITGGSSDVASLPSTSSSNTTWFFNQKEWSISQRYSVYSKTMSPVSCHHVAPILPDYLIQWMIKSKQINWVSHEGITNAQWV